MEQSLCIIKLRYLVNKDIVPIGSATSIHFRSNTKQQQIIYTIIFQKFKSYLFQT